MDLHQNSHMPSRTGEKSTFKLDGSAYKGLGLSGFDVGQSVTFLVTGKVTSKKASDFEEGVVDLIIRVDEVKDESPRPDMDDNNRRR
tara:strand:+ start:251 stop:511 length:261 start_codon:yes stop_codon:yes gene_type:complete